MPEHAKGLAERRKDPRHMVAVPALLIWGAERYQGTLRNLAPRGLFLTLERRAEELQEEDPVEVVVEELDLHREATISRVEPSVDGDEPVGVAIILHEDLDPRPIWDRYR